VISKSLGNLALSFLHFCKKYDICNLSRGALTGAYGKIHGINNTFPFLLIHVTTQYHYVL